MMMDSLLSIILSYPVETLFFLVTAGLIFLFLKPSKGTTRRPREKTPKKNTKQNAGGRPDLIDLVRSRRWDDVLLRIDEDPSEGRTRTWSGNRSTPLHLAALYRAPVGVICALLDAYPDAAHTVDSDGCTPQHVALLYGAEEECCLALIQEGGAAAARMVSVHMGSALHVCCRHGSSVEVVRELLLAEPALPKLSCPGFGGGEGLAPPVLWQTFVKRGNNRNLLARMDDLGRDALMAHVDLREMLEKMSLLLQTVAYGEGRNENKAAAAAAYTYEWRESLRKSLVDPSRQVVHLAVQYYESLRLPFDLLRLLALIYSEQLLQPNHDGSLPLHLAAERPRQAQRSLNMGDTVRNTDSIVDELVKTCPRAAGVHNASQRLPMILAIESGYTWTDGVKAVLYAAPDALMTRDTKTHLYPFMLASSLGEQSDVGTIYGLLRACPEAIRI